MSTVTNPVKPSLLEARVATLEELLVVHEEVVLVQSQRLAQALTEVTDLNAELETRVSMRTQQLSEANDALRQQYERERLMLEVSNAVIAHLNLKDLLTAVSDCLHRFFRHDTASLTLFNPQNGELRVHALTGAPDNAAILEGTLMPLEGTPPGLAIKTRQTVLRERVDLTEFHSPVTRQAYELGLRSGCSVLLISHDRLLGTLNVASLREAAFTRTDAALLEQIAAQIAIAVENALAYREIEALKNKLNEEKLYLEEEISTVLNFEQIIGASGSLKRILKQVETVAPADSRAARNSKSPTCLRTKRLR
jgi:formate hydrogenlyase transcriptional activator